MDPRDAAAWGRFDRVLSRFEGRGPGDGEDDSAASGGGGTPRSGSLTAGSSGAAAASAPDLGKLSPPGGDAGDEGAERPADLLLGGRWSLLGAYQKWKNDRPKEKGSRLLLWA